MVVCRQSIEESDFHLQFYKTRVIPAVEESRSKKRSKYEVPLNDKSVGINLYSSLDKTIALWFRIDKGTKIFLLRPRSAADSVEWYTFLRIVLGWRRALEIQVNVPDFDLTLNLGDPFNQLELPQNFSGNTHDDSKALLKIMEEEEEVADTIIKRCLELLEDSPEWNDVVSKWLDTQRIGLAWKRYDRLEWIHGLNERNMYGTIAMIRTHDLELRPKQHYPTAAETRSGDKLEEPMPVEGFLVRLTSQRGREQRFGRLFFKRLYFSTHNHLLAFSRPANAALPPPPKLPPETAGNIPSVSEIAEQAPLMYDVDPYPLEDGAITWLSPDRSVLDAERQKKDRAAYAEAERKFKLLYSCDGYIDMLNIVQIRNVVRGAAPADANIDEGSDVDFDAEVQEDSHRDDGATTEFEDNRTFEIKLKNGLVLRLQVS
jgi:hypothetical protein